ncbi:MAG: nucleotidyltransferase family protein [Actinobacteria bacterium]|nr:nucleotidyltransferase family protein [Actinomycetota bacterium]
MPDVRSAVILAAGEGRRLLPLTAATPKVMLPLAGRPLLEHLIRLCRQAGATEVYLNLFHAKQKILDHCGDGATWGVHIHYLHIPELRPPLTDVHIFADEIAGPFFVLYGDVATTLDLAVLAVHHARQRADATMVLRATDHPHDSDLAAIGPAGFIQRFVPKGTWAGETGLYGNAGCYVLESEFVRRRRYQPGTDFIDGLFAPALPQARLAGYVSTAWMLDIGTPERYARAQAEFRPAV